MSKPPVMVTVDPLLRFPFAGEGQRPGVPFQVEREQADRMIAEGYVREMNAAAPNKRRTYDRRDMRAVGDAG